ncbi:MAG: glutathione peroxidase [Alphaproteobacteria bacterium]|nr:glutathione peroxidase [Alphaproteobacteria bacterium]
MSAHDFTFRAIEGGDLPLGGFRGKAVLVVNTASQCGFTPQYAGLQELWRRYRERGLVVLGVPSNDFGGQEPGSAAEIKEFCEVNFDVDFPLTEKQRVIGADAHPFYRWIASELGEGQLPRWNFHKYLVAPDGSLAGTFPTRVRPDAPELIRAIEEILPAVR